ncbi:ubiquitin carboxyl-terminal hydrolase puf [Musca vetustissima]|uniref:ubiquitin carboxyl-terminal hydrolase puf n=1 Tax=Musca vetustissima TaxID=27455 RepID=UPI002AB608F2|nr:ubiquitin carboxyl-terminal hydrolase puf [Musca vetustissima]
MCDICSDFQQLLESYEARITSNDAKHSIIYKSEIETAFGYIQAWPQRQCMCLYRDTKNFERFNLLIQSMICLAVHHLKHIKRLIEDYKKITAHAAVATQASSSSAHSQQSPSATSSSDGQSKEDEKHNTSASQKKQEEQEGDPKDSSSGSTQKQLNIESTESSDKKVEGNSNEKSDDSSNVDEKKPQAGKTSSDSAAQQGGTGDKTHTTTPQSSSSLSPSSSVAASTVSQHTEEPWILPEVEKLLLLVSKIFLLNFPLYIAYKHSTHARLDDISAEEAQHLAIFCDLHDNEIPVHLLRNTTLFCNSNGFAAMKLCFDQPDLPVTTAHAITATVSNIKLWLHYGCIVQLYVPLRSKILQYMCKLSDQNLRTAATRAMADFVWSAVRDPLDASVSFDVEGLALAFKYFTSTTLTMRLAGITQINAHINIFGEIETVGEFEVVAQKIANWLTENQIIQHLFGPNLHVEVLKQAHIVLNFLAVENQITEEHIKLIWQATQQLKHCSKAIFDILPSLVKNLAPKPAMYLYTLLCRMDPKEHTEQSIYIASALTKLIWSRDSAQLSLEEELMAANATATSSDSGSMDGSNSDEGNGDDSSLASARKSPIDIENVCSSDTGVTPCKQARRRRQMPIIPLGKIGKDITEDDIKVIKSKTDMKMKNHRIVNIIDNSSSEDDMTQGSLNITLHRKKSRKRTRKNNSNMPLTRLAYEIVEAICDGGEDDASSDDGDEGDDPEAELLNDSDDCSDNGQVPGAVLSHLHGGGPYIRAIADSQLCELVSGPENSQLCELVSGPENEGSYSSPMSNKSEKNLADFDDEDVSPCEEEIAQLVSSHAQRVSHNCMPPALAAAAAAMAAAHTAMSMQKNDANVAAAAAAVAVAAVATGNAQQSLLAMQQQANAAAMAKAVTAGLNTNAAAANKHSNNDGDMDMSKECNKIALSSSISPQQPTFKINDVCQPGNTLLWDLLQDDKIGQLGESLALEAEKALATLLCFSNDRHLRTKFIEGCLQNLANNRSVIVSLRLLPKLFASFQQFRPSDTHQVTMWAERQHRMMYHFFNNIKYYAKRHMEYLVAKATGNEPAAAAASNELSLYSHKTQVSVRLQFLSSIFSSMGSPKTFRLSLEQVDALWEWLAHDADCSDCYFSWLQSQAKGGDQHALGLDALQHLYLKKLPELRPEDFSMVALGLFQQLCSLARMAIAHYEKQMDAISTNSSNIVGMFHLWKIALRAHTSEVSLAAIQYINMYYMGQQLRLEKEFVSQCMEHLTQAANALECNNEDENALMCVQRGLMLLNTHLDTFRRRYAFHLRRWAIEGQGIGSHSNLKNEGSGPAIRIILQPAGLSEKSILHMHACDLIADLKAEISKWWENLQGTSNSGVSAPVLGLLLSEGPLRIITQGQELSSEYDERTLGDAGFKDNQIVFVSLGGRGARRKETNIDHPSMQPPPPKECLPTVLLLQPKYFEKLFSLMQTLGDMKPQPNNLQLHTKAQILSRRVWDILAILPTNPTILDAFKGLASDLTECDQYDSGQEAEKKENKHKEIKQKLCDLLDPSNLQKFMYSLHIVESLALHSVFQQRGGAPCCGGVNGNIISVESSRGGVSKSKKTSSSRRRNSIESPHSNTNNKDQDGDSPKAMSSDERDNSDMAATAVQKEAGGGGNSSMISSMNTPESEHHTSSGNHVTTSDKEPSSPIKHMSKKAKKTECTAASSTASSSSAGGLMETSDNKWSEIFIRSGGLKHLYDIFISGQLQQSSYPKELLNEWRHDCLASLLRILWLLGFEEDYHEDMLVSISKPKEFMLEMMSVDSCLRRLSSILNDEAYSNYLATTSSYQYHHLRTGFWGRAQVVQFAMNIMVSFVHASAEARKSLWTHAEYCNWVQKFILEDPEPAVRREICAGLYRICLGNSQSYQLLLAPLLRKLISFLPVAEKMTSYNHHNPYMLTDDGKEPYGPACRDYFWLLARLVDTLSPEMVKSSLESSSFNGDAIDVEKLCQSVAQSILTREFYETRYGMQDDGLVGLINLMSNLVKYDPTFKFSPQAVQFIEKIFEFLFDMPSPNNRQKPKCKSATSRAAAYDLLVELCKNCPKNYTFLHQKLLAQHTPGPKPPYPWDYWPRDEGRSECGYVGLTNLGATCYMASCIQHLYMMPQARAAVLRVPPGKAQKHAPTLLELQRMFAYLLESERKAYNPRSFCRVYQMDHQPLNTGEQKDMAEFFIDLVSKLEEMTPDLKDLVKRLFCGTLSNNVVSLDCDHVSRTAEEFYTVRCQVADMRNLQESLDEVTVKDTLEGDNMYTCSQCGKKVRAEKRACFKKLPQILCFNTMRYTFNMVTMLKEKVNTHFSFPMRLNMSDYVEKTLMPHQYKEDREKRKAEGNSNDLEDDLEECLEYELVGVTVHTGTADGGHYYSFIKERNKSAMQHDRWFLFNDAEVKPFDPSQIAAECFGGEMTSKTYDSVTEKYLDFSFEKTNSAYMLFYERRLPDHLKEKHAHLLASPPTITSPTKKHENTGDVAVNEEKGNKTPIDGKQNEEDSSKMEVLPDTGTKAADKNKCDSSNTTEEKETETPSTSSASSSSVAVSSCTSSSLLPPNSKANDHFIRPQLSKELEDWIWQDNRQFLQDRNIFEHTYFNFMWQICGHIPQTLIAQQDVTCMAAKLSVSFFIETFIHAKEKPTMVPWVELLTKQFNASQEACEWFLTHMSMEPWWPVQVLIQCPNQMVRQMFQRLVIHVIQRLRASHCHLYLKTESDVDDKEVIGTASCVTRFISSLTILMEHGAKAHLRNLSEFFGLLFEFSRMGDEETLFLLRIGVIKSVADFYLGNKTHDNLEVGSDNDDNSSDEALSVDKTRPASLDKMIALVASLVERSRGPDLRLKLSPKDYNAIAGGKGFPFLYQQIKDNINPHQTRHLIHALCRWDERLANQIITMLFSSVTKHTELCGPFFKLLTLLTETQGGPSGLPCFSQLVLQRVWDAAEYCPQSALDWLAFQAPKNKIAHAWILQSADTWVEQYLLAHHNSRVRNAAAYLLVSLVPSQPFRANFRIHSLHKLSSSSSSHIYRELNNDAQIILHNIINLLLRLLRPARAYADIGVHGTTKLTSYFSLLAYCMASKTEKLMMGPYMRALWDLFHPRLSEPSVPAHHNKHALLAFWHHTIVDCPENALIVANCPEITRNIAFNYILADHDDSEIVAYNRAMLPAYYGLLRLCCEQSRSLTRQLAAHQNLQWAFKNITPHPTQYAAAVDELFKLMTLFATRHMDASDQEKHEVTTFRRTTLSAYLTGLDARVSWGTLINAFRILVDNEEDRLLVIYNGGLEMCFEALHTLHSMHHEATACHVSGDLQELLSEMVLLLSTLRLSTRLDSNASKKQQQQLEQQVQQLQAQHQQLLQKQQEQLKQQQQSQQQSQQSSPQQSQQQQKEKQLQQQMQQIQLQQMQQQLQQQHFLRQHQQHTALLKGLPDAVKRLATFLNTYSPPELCCLALDVLKELVRNPNLDVTSILAPILLNCHMSAASAPNAIGPLGPYFPRRGGGKTTWPTMAKNMPRPPRPMVQMCIPHSELLHRGVDFAYDAQVEAFYRPYHDFLDVMMRMAVNTNQLNDTLVRLSCLAAIEAAPLGFNYFPKFWVGIYNNKSTNKYAELLLNTQYLVEYIHIILRDCRVSLSDQYIRGFLEIYYPKVSSQLPIARLLYSISYSMHSKEDLDDLCGDLFAIRVFAQCTGIPASVRKQLRGSLKALLYKSARYQEMAEDELFPNKKLKLDNDDDKDNKKELNKTTTTNEQQSSKKQSCNDTTTTHDEDKRRHTDDDADAEKTATKPKEEVEDSFKMTKEEEETLKRCLIGDNDNEEAKKKPKISTDETEKETTNPTITTTDTSTNKTDIKENDKHKEAIKSPVKETKESTKTCLLETPSTSAAAAAAALNSATYGNTKKTADERLMDEHEKRIKLLLTMETYIKSILILMQKEESNSPNATAAAAAGNQSMLDETMESEQNTTPIPESSDEGGGGCNNNNSQGSAFNCNSTTNSSSNNNTTNSPENQKESKTHGDDDEEEDMPMKDADNDKNNKKQEEKPEPTQSNDNDTQIQQQQQSLYQTLTHTSITLENSKYYKPKLQ